MARDNWYRLDNIGKYYSAQAGSSNETVFRCAATLDDEVDETILQHALNRTVVDFPSFNVCLRSGVFWHYLEQSSKLPVVTQENLPICFGLHLDTRSILFRVSYYRRRVNLEVSHMVSDGRGALSFFRKLLSAYVQERYTVADVPGDDTGSYHQKSEDSYDKYFEKDKAGSSRAPRVFRLLGWRDVSDPTFMEYHLPLKSMLDLAHESHVSLTSFLAAAAICAIRDEMPRRDRQRAIRFDVPVDLRRFFESSTIKNFFGLAYVSYVPGDIDEPLEDIAVQVQTQLTAATQLDALKSRMNHMIALEKNPFLRVAPANLKDFALHIANRAERRKNTATISNLGVVELPGVVAAHVHDIAILTSTTGLNLLICSFKDDLSIGISTIYTSPCVIRNLCRLLSERGVEGRIDSNRAYDHRFMDRGTKRTGEGGDDETL